ncbi:MAG: helix-turn-helix domain-containing protein [Firmicutes bacterium]|nr:helix-turn-helix domain-containing protein [Bacillota bacterium]
MKSSLDNLYEISMLMDFYGALLSQRQQDVMRLYHEENCSLQEIADELGISRQGVHEALKKAESTLQGFEDKLGLVERFRAQEQVLQKALQSVDSLLDGCADADVRSGLLAIKHDINSIEEQV